MLRIYRTIIQFHSIQYRSQLPMKNIIFRIFRCRAQKKGRIQCFVSIVHSIGVHSIPICILCMNRTKWKNEAFSVANGTIKHANMSLHIGQWIRYVQLNINLLPLTRYYRNWMKRFSFLFLCVLWLVFVCWNVHKNVWRIVLENACAYARLMFVFAEAQYYR